MLSLLVNRAIVVFFTILLKLLTKEFVRVSYTSTNELLLYVFKEGS